MQGVQMPREWRVDMVQVVQMPRKGQVNMVYVPTNKTLMPDYCTSPARRAQQRVIYEKELKDARSMLEGLAQLPTAKHNSLAPTIIPPGFFRLGVILRSGVPKRP